MFSISCSPYSWPWVMTPNQVILKRIHPWHYLTHQGLAFSISFTCLGPSLSQYLFWRGFALVGHECISTMYSGAVRLFHKHGKGLEIKVCIPVWSLSPHPYKSANHTEISCALFPYFRFDYNASHSCDWGRRLGMGEWHTSVLPKSFIQGSGPVLSCLSALDAKPLELVSLSNCQMPLFTSQHLLLSHLYRCLSNVNLETEVFIKWKLFYECIKIS